MALADQEKTEAPTQKRRDDAREEGRIPRSQELTTSFVLLGAAMLLNLMGGSMGSQIMAIFADGMAQVGSVPLGADSAVSLVRTLGTRVLVVIGGWGGALMLLGLGLPVTLFPPLQPFGVAGATLLCLGVPDPEEAP